MKKLRHCHVYIAVVRGSLLTGVGAGIDPSM